MTVIKTRELKSALLKKGFKLNEGSHHFYQLFDDQGRATNIFTKISHSHNEIGDPLINSVKKDMHLEKEQLIKYSNCTLSKKKYYTILKSKKLI